MKSFIIVAVTAACFLAACAGVPLIVAIAPLAFAWNFAAELPLRELSAAFVVAVVVGVAITACAS